MEILDLLDTSVSVYSLPDSASDIVVVSFGVGVGVAS
jgi:hypothetical protein